MVGRPSGHDLGGCLAARANSPALLEVGACRRTRYVRFAHCAQTAAASQTTKHARFTRVRPRALRCSAPYTHAGGRPAPASTSTGARKQLATTGVAGSRGRVPGRARVRRRAAQEAGPARALARASWSDLPQLFERSDEGAKRVLRQALTPRSRPDGHPTTASRPDRQGKSRPLTQSSWLATMPA